LSAGERKNAAGRLKAGAGRRSGSAAALAEEAARDPPADAAAESEPDYGV
jgi:hypothetical protein